MARSLVERQVVSEEDGGLADPSFLSRIEQLQLLSRRIFRGRQRAERRSRKTGASLEFADYREFVPGDDLRNVDWSVYGRSDRLYLKQYEEEEDLHVYLLVDCSASMQSRGAGVNTSKFDVSRRLAAALAYIALCSLDRVDVFGYDASLGGNAGMRRGRQQFHVLLKFLRSLQPSGSETALANAARLFVSRMKRRGLVIIFSDFLEQSGAEDALNVLRYARFDVQVVQVLAPEEVDPGVSGDLQLIDSETGERLAVNASRAVLEDYRQSMKLRVERLAAFCAKRGIACAQTLTNADFGDTVLRLLRESRIVG